MLDQKYKGAPKTCKECLRKFSNRKGTLCNTCLVNVRRFKIRTKIMEFFGGPTCQRCGYTGCLGALNVHHIDPGTKEFSLSGAHCRSWNAIEKELKKCILICANCHQQEHHNCERYGCTSGLIPSLL